MARAGTSRQEADTQEVRLAELQLAEQGALLIG